ncbi:MAG: NADH dehydrogenase ubiquinone Fe-S protein 4 [Robiginitomaculum sp.]
MIALITQMALNAMQSGSKGYDKWVLKFPKNSQRRIDPLTGNATSMDMLQELSLSFETKEEAITYAKAKGIAFRLIEKAKHKPVGRSYANNFAFERKFPWTH